MLEKYIADKRTPPTDPVAPRAMEKAAADGLAALETLTDARQKLDAAKAKLEGLKPTEWKAEDIEARNNAQAAYYQALKNVLARSVDPHDLTNLIQAAASAKDPQAQKDLAALPERYPLERQEILALIAARQAEIAPNDGDSPEEIQRLVTSNGILDFRIAVLPGEVGTDLPEVRRSLVTRGPEAPVTVNGTTARWFAIDPDSQDNFGRLERDPADPGKVKRVWNYVVYSLGDPYILCYDDHDHTLTHSDPARKPWTVSALSPYNDSASGSVTLPFRLDRVGASYLGDLTGHFRGHPLAILVDNRAMSAPNIASQINDAGVITFGAPTAAHPLGAIQKEAEQLRQVLDAGSLPARLERQPISVTDVPPAANYRPFPWRAAGTLGPLPVLVVALWLALRAAWPRQPPAGAAFAGPSGP